MPLVRRVRSTGQALSGFPGLEADLHTPGQLLLDFVDMDDLLRSIDNWAGIGNWTGVHWAAGDVVRAGAAVGIGAAAGLLTMALGRVRVAVESHRTPHLA